VVHIGLFVFSIVARNDAVYFLDNLFVIFLGQDVFKLNRVLQCAEAQGQLVGWDVDHVFVLFLQTYHLFSHYLLHVGPNQNIHSAVVTLSGILFRLEEGLCSSDMAEV